MRCLSWEDCRNTYAGNVCISLQKKKKEKEVLYHIVVFFPKYNLPQVGFIESKKKK